MSGLTHIHRRLEHHDRHGPVQLADQLPTETKVQRFNARLALKITQGVGTMYCAFAFAVLALISLPDAIKVGRPAIISWIAQTFLQLVLLSIILVGQNIAGAASDKRAEETLADTIAVQKAALEIHTLVECVHDNQTGQCPGHPELEKKP